MDITSSNPSVEEFQRIYPDISLNIEKNEKDKLITFFNIINRIKRKKSSVILDYKQIKKIMKNQNKSNVSSINLDNKEILSIQKINKNETNKDKVLYKIIQKDEDVEQFVDKLNEDFFLINKGIEQQNRKLKRTTDVKKALELFLENSELIQRLSKYYGFNNSSNPFLDKNIDEKIKIRMKKIISNLAENVLIERYEKNQFIIRKNEIGKDCYFLISGRLSILKPVEYKYIKISYEDYLKYLLNLRYNKEDLILKTVTNMNWAFMKIYNEENLLEITKYYIQKRISVYSNISYDISNINIKEDLTLDNIESFLFDFTLKFDDFGLSKEKIISDLKKCKLNEKSNDYQLFSNNYFKDIFKIDKKTQMEFKIYDYLFESNPKEKEKLVTLYKYETFLYLYPGAFFGEMSLDSENKRRNASIRTEKDSIVISLSVEKYSNYLMDENKKIFVRQINFLCHNFFFNNISLKIFSKYYFPMFKLINKAKDNIIYEQGDTFESLYFIREGSIKYELNSSICELHNLIFFLINKLKNSIFNNLNNSLIGELKAKYLKNHNLIKSKSSSIILTEKINNTHKFELNLSESHEVIGLPEFFLELPYLCNCSVVSQNTRLFELNRYNLNNIISNEKTIKEGLHKLVLDKIIIFIRRLFNIENNFITDVISKIDSNFFNINDTNFYSEINYQKNHIPFVDNKNSSQMVKEETKNKNINKNENLLIIKKYAKIGYVNEDVLKNQFYSPIKFNKKYINPKLISDIQNFNSSRVYPKLNLEKIYEENSRNTNNNSVKNPKNFQINNRKISEINIKGKILGLEQKIIKKESPNIIKQLKLYEESKKINNNSIINKNIHNLDNTNDIKTSNETLINIGKTYISLPKLRKLITSSSKPKEDNLSIIQNKYDNNKNISETQRNISLNEDESLINEPINSFKNSFLNNKNNKISLPDIKRQNSCNSFPLYKKIKRKINNNIDYKENRSEMNRYHDEIEKKYILAAYIKHYYKKQKNKGYSALLNPKNNTIVKKKINKSLLNFSKK